MSIEIQTHRANNEAESEKAIYLGTHRSCLPEVTLARIQPFLARMGVTRVADVTYLDDLGIPVFQAVRPNSRNLSVSQGKGVTRLLAKVSAIMEACETWHAEQLPQATFQATIAEMEAQLPYSIYDLNLVEQHVLHERFLLEWLPGKLLTTGEQTFLPAGYVRLDLTTTSTWLAPTFNLTSNGLASGNTHEEAILHSLYEIIERDTLAQLRMGTLQEHAIDPQTVDGPASAPLLERLKQAGADVAIKVASGQTGIPCFIAHIVSSNYPIVAPGYGCHLDRDVALSRALTEAAQSRLTMISGTRDDIDSHAYTRIQRKRRFAPLPKADTYFAFDSVPSVHLATLREDLDEVKQRFFTHMQCSPIIVDLTRPDMNIPVVFVAAPQLRFLETHK